MSVKLILKPVTSGTFDIADPRNPEGSIINQSGLIWICDLGERDDEICKKLEEGEVITVELKVVSNANTQAG